MKSREIQSNEKKVHTFLEKWLDKSIKQYVGAMDEKNNGHLHELIIGGIEKPLVEIVLKETNGNQTQASNILGINRNTCLLYTSPSPRDGLLSRMPSSA